jgi:putative PIN family toxin of toxin-antitoxin system
VPDRVVFDCNIFTQTLISPDGPAGRCVELVLDGRLILFWSDYVLGEVRRIPEKATPRRLGIDSIKVERLIARLLPIAHHVTEPPHLYEHPVDPKDSHYVNLAVAARSKLIVSRDKHLLHLTDPSSPLSAPFMKRFPGLTILQPEGLLRSIRPDPGDASL